MRKVLVTLEVFVNENDFDSQGELEWAVVHEIERQVIMMNWDVPDDWPLVSVTLVEEKT